tara:strand:- start:10188 stop:11978 length:1791 start_codon:yes stop_codon:yes gene_type:complete
MTTGPTWNPYTRPINQYGVNTGEHTFLTFPSQVPSLYGPPTPTTPGSSTPNPDDDPGTGVAPVDPHAPGGTYNPYGGDPGPGDMGFTNAYDPDFPDVQGYDTTPTFEEMMATIAIPAGMMVPGLSLWGMNTIQQHNPELKGPIDYVTDELGLSFPDLNLSDVTDSIANALGFNPTTEDFTAELGAINDPLGYEHSVSASDVVAHEAAFNAANSLGYDISTPSVPGSGTPGTNPADRDPYGYGISHFSEMSDDTDEAFAYDPNFAYSPTVEYGLNDEAGPTGPGSLFSLEEAQQDFPAQTPATSAPVDLTTGIPAVTSAPPEYSPGTGVMGLHDPHNVQATDALFDYSENFDSTMDYTAGPADRDFYGFEVPGISETEHAEIEAAMAALDPHSAVTGFDHSFDAFSDDPEVAAMNANAAAALSTSPEDRAAALSALGLTPADLDQFSNMSLSIDDITSALSNTSFDRDNITDTLSNIGIGDDSLSGGAGFDTMSDMSIADIQAEIDRNNQAIAFGLGLGGIEYGHLGGPNSWGGFGQSISVNDQAHQAALEASLFGNIDPWGGGSSASTEPGTGPAGAASSQSAAEAEAAEWGGMDF